MKKLVYLLALLLFCSLVSAVDIQLSKETYSPGETLQAEIYGNFLDGLSLENIHFYRERNLPLLYDVLKLKDKYLLYAVLPYKEGNYTLVLEDVRYTTETGSDTTEITKQFQISSTNTSGAIFTINPGFVVARDDFFIQVKATENTEVSGTLAATSETQTKQLLQGVYKKLYFSIGDVKNYTETTLTLAGYTIPVFIFPSSNTSTTFINNSVVLETDKFRFSPLEIYASVLEDEAYTFTANLLNLQTVNLTDISLESDLAELTVNQSEIAFLESGDEHALSLIFSSSEEGDFSGKVTATTANLSTDLIINIEVTTNESDVNIGSGTVNDLTCDEMGGAICISDETCQGTNEPSVDGFCCIGTCQKEEPNGDDDFGWFYGVLVIVVALAAVVLLFWIAKRKQKKSPDVLKQKEHKFNERMKGQPTKGNLDKV